MKYLAAILLLHMGGNASPTAVDVKRLLSTVGSPVDEERLQKLLSELDGKDINVLLEEGRRKLATVHSSTATFSAGAAAIDTTPDEGTKNNEEVIEDCEFEGSDDEMVRILRRTCCISLI